MSRWAELSKQEKLRARILARPRDMTVEEVCTFLRGEGWGLARYAQHAHPVFEKDGYPPLYIAVVGGQKVTRTYLTKICEHLGLEDD